MSHWLKVIKSLSNSISSAEGEKKRDESNECRKREKKRDESNDYQKRIGNQVARQPGNQINVSTLEGDINFWGRL